MSKLRKSIVEFSEKEGVIRWRRTGHVELTREQFQCSEPVRNIKDEGTKNERGEKNYSFLVLQERDCKELGLPVWTTVWAHG